MDSDASISVSGNRGTQLSYVIKIIIVDKWNFPFCVKFETSNRNNSK